MADGDDAFPDLSAGDPQIADSDDSDEFFCEEGFEGYSGEAQSLPPDTPEVLGAGAAAAEAVFAGDIDYSNSPASNATPSSAGSIVLKSALSMCDWRAPCSQACQRKWLPWAQGSGAKKEV